MDLWDILLLLIVYVYVACLFIFSEKCLKRHPEAARKFIHIMVGNCIFIMPFFHNPLVMVYFLTIPITIFAFLLTKYSPIKIKSTVTDAGHDLGLVYYAGVWSILIFIFPDYLWIVALAIAAMVYGDGFASLIGQKYGRHKYNLIGDQKSIEGSLTMFIVIIIASIAIFIFYNAIGYPTVPKTFSLITIIGLSLIATVTEAITPKGLDNLSVCVVTAILYYILMVVF